LSVSDYSIETIVSEDFGQNAYVLWKRDRTDAVAVDPGFETDAILRLLHDLHRELAAILNTHGHVDHIAGNRTLKLAFPHAPLIIGRHEAELLLDPRRNLSGPFGVPVSSPPADQLVDDGERVEVAGFEFLVREIPGHSPGSVVYLSQAVDPPFVLGGDVLFAGSIGRTDLGGDYALLMTGILEKLMSLPGETIVYSGHGPATTIDIERRTNPFVLDFAARSRPR
jgi:hydroxyacylglutathione hydrolase